MAVRGTPLPPHNQPPRSTGIISEVVAQEAARHTVRWTSLIVLVISILGTIFAVNGGAKNFPYFWNGLSVYAVIGGLLIQVFCTVLEWGYRKQRTDPRYFVPLIFDVGGTYLGYAPLLAPVFAGAFARATLPIGAATVLGHLAVVLISVLAAYYPEQTLVIEE